jgi:uroporphyrinogen-III decarboxylase
MSLDEIHSWIGSDKLAWLPRIVREVRRSTSVEISQNGHLRTTAFCSPSGETQRVDLFDQESQAWHPVRFPVRNLRDIRIMADIYADCTVEIDPEGLREASARCQALGQDAVTSQGIGESPLMYWVEWLAGIENAHYMLADHQPEVEALFEVMHRVLLRTTTLLVENSPADMLNFTENTSTTLVSPAQYRRYWLGHIREYGLVCQQASRLLFLHMCGHLKTLLPDLATLPVNAFEAFTSPTVGNTTLLDGRTACPDKCLIGGTNAILWLESDEAIIDQIDHDLTPLPHHRGLAITSAGVMPPGCPPEKIKAVCDWVKGYQARL